LSFLTRLTTYPRLGIRNLVRVAIYRLGLKLGVHPVRRLQADVPTGPYFRVPSANHASSHRHAPRNWRTHGLLFGHWPYAVSDAPPDWHRDPLNGTAMVAPERLWWQIPDFDRQTGDIKTIWELSRFDWVLAFAQQAALGDTQALQRLNTWLADWSQHNPPYRGANWKCGQEASIRVMHLAMAALILDQNTQPEPGLVALIQVHLQRIAPTLSYAVAQDNNHGTSEAAALYIGGYWLAAQDDARGKHWARSGRRWLENRTARLIGSQGSFSQYSLNYHRVLLDTLSMVEVWRRQQQLPELSQRWQQRAQAATGWLWHMIQPENGDGPNLGANDGARLLPLTDSAYRDYRPSVQLATALFANQAAYPSDGDWNQPLHWLRIPLPHTPAPPTDSYLADDGGFAVLHQGPAQVLLRYPRYRFRPSQTDPLHLDLWLNGNNLLRDAGSYSYHTEPRWLDYFNGVASHNTVQFDAREPMPRLSRFLLGRWLQTDWLQPLRQTEHAQHFGAGYRDPQGATHRRSVQLSATQLQITDQISGFQQHAVLRWRLHPGDWESQGTPEHPQWYNPKQHITLNIQATMPLQHCHITTGWESRHYLEKTAVPVLEITVAQPGTLHTKIHWPA
jgi:hypothetical protein